MLAAQDTAADLILRGGIVHPFSGHGRKPSAIALRAGRVLALGSDAETLTLAGQDTEVIDLGGRSVLPGINDAHLHGTWLGALWPETLFGDAPDMGTGQRNPLRDTGERRQAILRAGDLLSSLGITSYTEPGIGPGEDDGPTGAFGSSVLDEYRALADEGKLRTRVTMLSLFGELDGASNLADFRDGLANTAATSTDPRWLRVAGVKIFADGIPPMRTAYTESRYCDGHRPDLLVAGTDAADREANLTRMIMEAHHAGHQIGVHATGDRAIDLMLDAVRKARAKRDVDLGHYVIHGDLVTAAQLRRMAELDIGLDMQPDIALRTREQVDEALGRGAAAGAWPLAATYEAGVRLCLTTDAPVLSPDWRIQVAAADEWLGPAADTRLRMTQLLHSYTVTPARQDGAADWKGTLAPGMAADLCVLAADPYTISPAELPDVSVDLTVVDGDIVHDRRQQGIPPAK